MRGTILIRIEIYTHLNYSFNARNTTCIKRIYERASSVTMLKIFTNHLLS